MGRVGRVSGVSRVSRAVATAPVRIADVGGWTDTWFGSPGRVCHLAVGPGVTVEAALVRAPQPAADPHDPAGLPVRVVAPDLGIDCRTGPSPEHGWARPWPGRQPLLEHAVAAGMDGVMLVPGQGVDLSISSSVPPGASLGTSASVVVAVLAAFDALFGRLRNAPDLAAAAHRVETDRAGRESGVQDHWAAALGGCGLLAIGPYPEVRHEAVVLRAGVASEIGERVVTVVFGPHDSSAMHAAVIDAMVGCGGPEHDQARRSLRQLAALADDAARALRAGSVDRWAEVLTAATEAQAELHQGLVGAAHRAAIEVARASGATGWKVNGAGGEGGSLSVVAADGAAASRLALALGRVDPSWLVVDLTPAPGLSVVLHRG